MCYGRDWCVQLYVILDSSMFLPAKNLTGHRKSLNLLEVPQPHKPQVGLFSWYNRHEFYLAVKNYHLVRFTIWNHWHGKYWLWPSKKKDYGWRDCPLFVNKVKMPLLICFMCQLKHTAGDYCKSPIDCSQYTGKRSNLWCVNSEQHCHSLCLQTHK